MSEQLVHELQRFESCRLPRGTGGYHWSRHYRGESHGFHVVFGCMVHGDEVGSLPAVNRLLDLLERREVTFGGRVTVFVGNPEAGLAGQRFLERDLNRVFLDLDDDAHEIGRSRELRPLLDDADLFVDFHQTILATQQPFWICPWTHAAAAWARAAGGAEVWITRSPAQAFSPGTCCADEYVRLKGRPALTLELGEKGFDVAAEERALRVMLRIIELADAVASGGSLAELAGAQPPVSCMATRHRERFADATFALAEGWTNFAPVAAGTTMHATGTPTLVAPMDGFVVFPKYPPRSADGTYKQPLPGEIYRIVCPLDGDPRALWGESPEAGAPVV